MKLNEKIIKSLGLKETADTAATSRCGEAAQTPLLQSPQSLEDLFGSGGLNPFRQASFSFGIKYSICLHGGHRQKLH